MRTPEEIQREEDERKVMMESWLKDDWTKELREEFDKQAKFALEDLRAACSRSTDPEVRAKFTAWHAIESARNIFTHGKVNP